MRHLTIVTLGYISPDEAIYSFFFHHCINCLQPMVKLAEYDSFSVTATFPGNKSVTLGVNSNSQNLSLLFLIGRTKQLTVRKTFNMKVNGFR